MADEADGFAAEAAEAADDGGVFAVLAVAGQRHEIGNQRRDVVEAMRPLRMPRHLRFLPRRQPGIEFLERLRRLAFDAGDLVGDGLAVAVERAQFVDLGLKFGHRFFEVEVATHRWELAKKFERFAPNLVPNLCTEACAGLCKGAANSPAHRLQVKITATSGINPAPAGADRAPGFSAVLPAHGYKSAWWKCRRGRAASAPRAGRRHCATGDWRRHGAAHAG